MNRVRGEVSIMVDGRPHRLCLTLGALAEIEAKLGCATLAELDARMRRLSGRDLEIVLAALLRGGDEMIDPGLAHPGEAARAVAAAFVCGLGE